MNTTVHKLPINAEIETKAVLRQVALSHRRLAELKGISASMPNEQILINTLTLQEAKDSSAIENIITTHDEIFKAQLFADNFVSPATKEVQRYASALKKGFELVRHKKILSNNIILQIQQELEQNIAGYRKVPGTTLKNQQTGELVYTPPQTYDEIVDYMNNLEQYINDPNLSDVDPLIKLSIIHHQFESIHPFYDGNGRTGRIINILYLVVNDLLDLPILYLSRYMIKHKGEYYRLLQNVRETQKWEEWILFVLKGIEETSVQTIHLISAIKQLMGEYKHSIRRDLSKIYSQDLLNNLFKHPYTKIEFLEQEIGVSTPTATSYLKQLVDRGYLSLLKIGRNNYYLNDKLFQLLIDAHHGNSIE